MSTYPCLNCAGDTRVVDSRNAKSNAPGPIKRRRECQKCGHRFNTFEIAHDCKPEPRISGKKVAKALLSAQRSIDKVTKLAGISTAHQDGRWVIWTPEMDATLIEMRSRNESYLECAAKIGVGYMTVAQRCRKLGLGGKRNNGRTPGVEVEKGAGRDRD